MTDVRGLLWRRGGSGTTALVPASWTDARGVTWCLCGHDLHTGDCAVDRCPCAVVRAFLDDVATLSAERDAARAERDSLNDEALRWTEIAGQQAEQIGQLTADVETERGRAQDNHREALRAIGALESARGQVRDFERQRDAWKAVLGVGPGDIDTTPIQALAAFSPSTPEPAADREALIRRFAEWYRVYWRYDVLNDAIRDQAHEVYAMLVGTGTLPFSGQWQALTVEQIQAGAIAIRERLHSDPATRREIAVDVARAFGLTVPSGQVPGE